MIKIECGHYLYNEIQKNRLSPNSLYYYYDNKFYILRSMIQDRYDVVFRLEIFVQIEDVDNINELKKLWKNGFTEECHKEIIKKLNRYKLLDFD